MLGAKTCWLASLGLVLCGWAGAAWYYPQMPEQIPIHWNAAGQIDDYGQKQFWAFFTPGMLTVMLGILAALPYLSPKHFEISTFGPVYARIVLVVASLFTYIHVLLTAAAVNQALDTTRALFVGMGIFFALLGNLLGKVRRNFFVGVRTPWTIADERTWNDTHRVAAWTFTGAGLLTAVAGWLQLSPLAPLGVILTGALFPVVYSYFHYRKLQRTGRLAQE